MTTPQKYIIHTIAFILFVLLVVYVLYDVWGDFKLKELNQAYQQGKADTINALIQQSKNCQQVPIYSGTEKTQVIDTSCLNTSATE